MNKQLELHCVAICYDPLTDKVLVARRSADRKVLPGLWEFGCAKARTNMSIADAIKEEYKSDFGLNVDVACDESGNPIPLSTYQVEIDGKLYPGVVFTAKVRPFKHEDIIESIAKAKKHDTFVWLPEDSIESLEGPRVPDFDNRLRAAFQFWKQN